MRISFDIAFLQNDDRLLAESLEFAFPRTRHKWACLHNFCSIQKTRTDNLLQSL